MNPLYRFITLLSVAASSSVSYGALEFSGHIGSSKGDEFVIRDTISGESSGFLKIGGEFKGHIIREFDRRTEVLTLELDGKPVRLALKEGRILASDAKVPQKIQVKLEIAQTGAPAIDGKSLSEPELVDYLRGYAQSDTPLSLLVNLPLDPGKEAHAGVNKLHSAIAKAGLKKWSIKIIDGAPPKK